MTKFVETRTSGESIYQRVLLQEILQNQRDMSAELVKQGKSIARLQLRTSGIAAAVGAGASALFVLLKAAFQKAVM